MIYLLTIDKDCISNIKDKLSSFKGDMLTIDKDDTLVWIRMICCYG